MTLNHAYFIGGIIALFGLIGFWQVPAWEGCVMAGIVIAQLVFKWYEDTLVGWANKLYTMVRFALKGGLTAEDPGPILAEVRNLPSLIATDRHRLIFVLGTFALVALLAYIFGRVFFPHRPKAVGPLLIYKMPFAKRVVGGLLGAINGYLITYFVTPKLFPEAETTITFPSGLAGEFLGAKLPLVIAGFLIVVLLLGLKASSRS